MIDKFYVINLLKDSERLQNLKTNLDKYDIKFERFEAIYGKDLSTKEIIDNTTLVCRTLLCNKSIIGSGLSHYNLWKIIAQNPTNWYMICEDDINFSDHTIYYLNQIEQEMQGRENESIIISLNSCSSYNYDYNKNKKLLIKSDFICGISSYIITPEAARRLVNFINDKKINQYIDIQMSFCKCQIQHYYTSIPIITNSIYGGYETSNNMNNIYSLPLLQFLINLFLPLNISELINFRINISLICLFMKYCFTIGHFILLILLILYCIFKNNILGYYIILEIILGIMFKILPSNIFLNK